MGLAGTAAKLLASLDLDTKPFERGAARAGATLGKMESRFGKMGSIAKRGVGNLATNLTKIGVVAAGAIAVAVKSGIQSLADLERVQNQTTAVITSTGGAAGVTAVQVRALAESLEKMSTADDKAIQSGANLLLTFTNIGKDTFPRATTAMTNMAIALNEGEVEGANFAGTAIQIGKALNDPITGITALRKAGVSFTEQQKAQIKKMVESGNVVGAQTMILKELEKEFGKAGEAAAKGFGGDMRRLDDAFEDTRMALATGFLPVIRKVADKLSTELVKPEVQAQIMAFGDTLAGAFDKVLEIGSRLPWQQIGDSLKVAGSGAKAVFDAFAGMPAWVQTAVLTGWGLNKLSGGAIGDLAKEGFKVAFNLFGARGSSAANPLWVQSTGGVGGPGGKSGGSFVGGVGGILGTVAIAATSIVAISELLKIRDAQSEANRAQSEALGQQTTAFTKSASTTEMLSSLSGIESYQKKLATELTPESLAYALNIDGVADRVKETKAEILRGIAVSERTTTAIETMRGNMVTATRSAADRSVTAAERSKSAIVEAIRGIQNPIVNVTVVGNRVTTTSQTGTTSRTVNPNYLKVGLT